MSKKTLLCFQTFLSLPLLILLHSGGHHHPDYPNISNTVARSSPYFLPFHMIFLFQKESFFHLHFQFGEYKDIGKALVPAKVCALLKDNRKMNLNSCFLFDCYNWEVSINVKIIVPVLTQSRLRVLPKGTPIPVPPS